MAETYLTMNDIVKSHKVSKIEKKNNNRAFVNEKLTPEQREEFVQRKVKTPTSNNFAKPLYKTVDK